MNFKKIIFFLCFCFLFISPCKAITPTVEYQEGFYSNRIGPDKTYSGMMGFLVVDGKVVFCLEPYKIIGNSYEIDNSYFNNYSEDDLNYIKSVSNYADKFIQKRDIYYYMAAQELIWERLYGKDTVFFTTEKNGAGVIINLEEYKKEIELYVNDFFMSPSFEGSIIKDNFYSIVELEDTNGVLHQYDIVNDSLNMVWKEENKLYIKILSSQLSDIKLVRKQGSGTPIYYHSSTNQDLGLLNSSVENISYVSVQSNNEYRENININFLDKRFGSLITDTVVFQIIDLDNDKVVVENETSNGIYYTNLESGNYEIKVSKICENYAIPESIKFNISEENRLNDQSILVYIDKVMGKINVNSYKDDGLYQLYLNKGFEEKLINTFNETKSFDLELGNYYVIDISTGKKYDINLEYKDAYTPIIVYDLDIYPEKKEEDINKDGDNSEYYDQDISNSDKIGNDLNDKEDNNNFENKDETSSNEDENDTQEIKTDIYNNEDKNYQVNDSEPNEIEDDNNLDNKNEDNSIIENPNKLNNNLNKEIDEDQILDNDNKNFNFDNIDKEENIADKLILNNQDDVVENLKKGQTLPNTFDYMKAVKRYLFIILLLGIVVKFKKNEKE